MGEMGGETGTISWDLNTSCQKHMCAACRCTALKAIFSDTDDVLLNFECCFVYILPLRIMFECELRTSLIIQHVCC